MLLCDIHPDKGQDVCLSEATRFCIANRWRERVVEVRYRKHRARLAETEQEEAVEVDVTFESIVQVADGYIDTVSANRRQQDLRVGIVTILTRPRKKSIQIPLKV